MGRSKKTEIKENVFERKIEIGGRVFEIESNFRKSHKLSKYRNKLRYGTKIQITEENKEAFLEIDKLRRDTPEGQIPDVSKLSTEATNILMQMSDTTADVYEIEELIEIGKILTDIQNDEEIEELYNNEVAINGYDDLVTKILYGVQLVFMNVKDGSQEEKGHQVAEK